MTILQFLEAIIRALATGGAHHPYVIKHGHDGIVATHKFLAAVCRIPAGFHGIFHCSGWVRL